MPTERDMLNFRIRRSRSNLLLVPIFSMVNIILMLAQSSFYFLFTATVPYQIASAGAYLCGRLPAEYYTDWEGGEFAPKSILVITLVIAAVILGLYFLFYMLSKNKPGWLIGALVMFGLDSLYCLYVLIITAFDFEFIIDVAFHAWVLFYLVTGVSAYVKLKKLPPDSPEPEDNDYSGDGDYYN